MANKEKEIEFDDRYRSLFESAYDAIIIADAQTGMLIDANEEAEKLLGYKKNELMKLHQTQLHPMDDKDRYTKLFRDHINKKEAFEEDVIVVHKSGKKIHASIRANLIQMGDKQLLQGIFRDITKFKDVEDFLRNRIESLEEVLNFIKGREERIIGLKKEVDSLLIQLNKPAKYGY